jgi:hypothetical protein
VSRRLGLSAGSGAAAPAAGGPRSFPRPLESRGLRHLAVFAFFLALAIGLTWPLAPRITTAVSDPGDPLLNAWILDWVCHALVHQPFSIYDAPVFHPGLKPLAYSENLIAIGVLVLPFHLAGVPPIALYNIAMILAFALSGYGAFVLARMVSGSTIGALIGGVFFAFCSYKFDQLAHLQVVFSAWVPLTLAALLAFWNRATWKRGAVLALMFVLNGLTNVYFLMFTAVATLFTIAVLAVIEPRRRRFFAALALSLIAGAIVLYPFLRPYRQVSEHYKLVRLSEEVERFSATTKNWLVPSSTSRFYGSMPAPEWFAPEKQLFPGVGILMLAGVAFFLTWRDGLSARPRRAESPALQRADILLFLLLALAWAGAISERFVLAPFGVRLLAINSSDLPMMAAIALALFRFRHVLREKAKNPGAWAAAVWVTVGFLGTLGLNGFLYTFFYRRFEPFQAMRVPARYAVVAYAGLAVLGAIGAAAIVARVKRKTLVSAFLLGAMILEARPHLRWDHVPNEVAPLYRWLNEERVGPVLELPVWGNGIEYQYMLAATAHHVPIVNGISGFAPSEAWQARDAEQRGAYDELLGLEEKWGVRLLVIHGDALSGEQHARVADFIRRNVAAKRIAYLRRFDAHVVGDYVFAIVRTLPQWAKHAAPQVPDGAGNLPAQTLERFLSGHSTHSDRIVIQIEQPQAWTTIDGALHVQGWTVSPHGIKRVTVLFDGGKQRRDAQLVPRADVKAAYPWLYFVDKPGFVLSLPARPDDIATETSITIEVEDQGRRVRRSRELPITWE